MSPYSDKLTADLLRPLQHTSWRFFALVEFLGAMQKMS